jgi:hypothetical protein
MRQEINSWRFALIKRRNLRFVVPEETEDGCTRGFLA